MNKDIRTTGKDKVVSSTCNSWKKKREKEEKEGEAHKRKIANYKIRNQKKR